MRTLPSRYPVPMARTSSKRNGRVERHIRRNPPRSCLPMPNGAQLSANTPHRAYTTRPSPTAKLNDYSFKPTPSSPCGGRPAWSTARGLGPRPSGVRGFESHPPHSLVLSLICGCACASACPCVPVCVRARETEQHREPNPCLPNQEASFEGLESAEPEKRVICPEPTRLVCPRTNHLQRMVHINNVNTPHVINSRPAHKEIEL